MDYNSSSEDNSSTDCSTDSSDDDKLESIQVCGSRLEIPQGLCEQKDVLQELLSLETWNSLSEVNKQHLRTFLPTFPENNDHERNVTLQRLLDGEVFRFTSPLTDFHEHLKAGHYRPDIAKIKYMIRKAERKEAKCRFRRYRNHLKEEVLESHNKLLNTINNLPPGVEPQLERQNAPIFISSIAYRTKRRYFQELAAIRAKVDESGFSSDENYPEGPPAPLSRKQKRHLNSIKSSSNFERVFVSTMATKPNVLDLESKITPYRNPFFITDDSYKVMLINHKRRKLEQSDSSDLNTKGITTSDIIQRTKLTYIKKLNNNPSVCVASKQSVDNKVVNRKRLKKDNSYQSPEFGNNKIHQPFFLPTSNSEGESDSDSIDTVLSNNLMKNKNRNRIKSGNKHSLSGKIIRETKTDSNNSFNEVQNRRDKMSSPIEPNNVIKSPSFTHFNKITPATLSDLDGIDMMNLPIDLDDSNIDILDLNNKPELMQETHANFLSLIRDIICSTNEHRMNMTSLEERLRLWQENPISPLNDWYSLTDNWVTSLQSAINFLSGNFPDQPEDFVPYIEYKPQLEMYQWIGAGRDSDSLLSPLCQYWLNHRNEMNVQQVEKKEENEIDIIDRSQTPPPPRCPTTWSVRKAEPEEIKAFREQERQRYDNPHKAFTYRCNGYESVVGPLKGIYNPSVSNTKARGHTMLSADRPNFVTILSLVRDATARLPNGEGTRADICELLKSSQYISSTAPDNVLQSVVSGALDRMHTQFDPCVKYDPKRKIWIYLHRNRTEEDFERLHQQYQGMSKTMKKNNKSKSQNKNKPKAEKTKNNVKLEGNQNQANDKSKNIPKVKANNSPQLQQNSASQDVNRPTTSKQATSILLTSNQPQPKVDIVNAVDNVQLLQQQQQQQIIAKRTVNKPLIKPVLTTEEKDLTEALQVIQSRMTKTVPNIKGKSLVKIISPTQGKSLIIPTAAQINKNVDAKTGAKISHAITQQLIQTLANQQKQVNSKQSPQTIKIEIPEKTDPTKVQNKLTQAMQQQILHTISSQQLHNIKNVTLLRNVCTSRQSPILQTQNTSQAQTITLPQGVDGSVSQASVITVQKSGEQNLQTSGTPIRLQQTLTTSQQQLLQNLKQKVIPMQNAVITPQVILKQKPTGIQQGQKQIQTISGTSLLGQPRLATVADSAKPVISTGQTPLVAKVLTNAAGQVISVESLLAHQKQHGSLPQGTTLRVSGVKGGQANIIQLATPTKQGSIAQLAVGSQNNFITISSQPKLMLSSQPTSTVTSTVAVAKPITKAVTKQQTVTKVQPKVAQQVINAKFIAQNIDSQKIVQPKVIIGQNHQIKLGTNKNMTMGKQITVGNNNPTNTIRMVNATNLNLTHIGGKPVLLASKANPLQNIQGQNVILQSQTANATASNLVALNNTAKTISTTATPTSTVSLINAQNTQVLLGSQIKVQQPSQVVLSSNLKQNSVQQTQNVLLGGHTVRFQSGSTNASPQRVVLASQGQGGQIVAQQIVLPAGFQGTAINIKALQGVKVIPITQQGKGGQNRHLFARVMNPSNIVRIPQPASTPEVAAEVKVSSAE